MLTPCITPAQKSYDIYSLHIFMQWTKMTRLTWKRLFRNESTSSFSPNPSIVLLSMTKPIATRAWNAASLFRGIHGVTRARYSTPYGHVKLDFISGCGFMKGLLYNISALILPFVSQSILGSPDSLRQHFGPQDSCQISLWKQQKPQSSQ